MEVRGWCAVAAMVVAIGAALLLFRGGHEDAGEPRPAIAMPASASPADPTGPAPAAPQGAPAGPAPAGVPGDPGGPAAPSPVDPAPAPPAEVLPTAGPSGDVPFSSRRSDGTARPGFDNAASLPGYEATRGVRNPLSPGDAVLRKGRELYRLNCAPCHGERGAGDGVNPTLMGIRMRDLRVPTEYKYGASDEDLYRSIAYGLPGTAMGGLKNVLPEADLWSMLLYVKSLRQL